MIFVSLLNEVEDINIVDFNKKTTADYARSNQQKEVLQLLEKEFELQ